jgi:hypothetical protein
MGRDDGGGQAAQGDGSAEHEHGGFELHGYFPSGNAEQDNSGASHSEFVGVWDKVTGGMKISDAG